MKEMLGFNNLSRREKLLRISANFLNLIGVTDPLKNGFIERNYATDAELKVGANLHERSSRIFLPRYVELTIEECGGVAFMKLYRRHQEVTEVENQFSDYFIERFTDIFPNDLTAPVLAPEFEPEDSLIVER